MKLLITGGAGFIGSNFIRYWLESHPGDQIVNLDKLTYAGNLDNLKTIEENPNYTFVKGDITDLDLMLKLTADVDQIVHFAAESHVDRSIEGPFPFVRTNVEGTLSLLEAARQNNVKRFHHISTDEVFGSLDLDSDDKFDESTPYDPRSPYSASKAASDHLVRAYHETHGLGVTISNCSNNYGPFHHPEKLIPLVITRAIYNEPVPVYGDGENVRDWIHVSDHNMGVAQIIEHGQTGETYLLGGDGEKSNIEIVEMILDKLGRSHDLIKFVPDRKGHDKRYAIDFTKAKNEVGFTPKKSFETWLDETVKWYQENEWWWKELKNEANKMAEKYLSMAE